MADIITAFWWSYLLYIEMGAATDGPGQILTTSNLIFVALFAGAGFIIGK